jgi:hypothetical protein
MAPRYCLQVRIICSFVRPRSLVRCDAELVLNRSHIRLGHPIPKCKGCGVGDVRR